LVAESSSGRYHAALEALAEYLPLVVIELRTWRGNAEATLVADVVIINESLDIAGAALPGGVERTEADWKSAVSDDAWAFKEEFFSWANGNLGEVRVDYSPKSYIGIRRGRRVWAPLWFRRDGARTYLPDPDGLKGDEQSPAMDVFQERLRDIGVEINWTPAYNAGSNPVAVTLTRADINKPEVRDFLRATFHILDHGAVPWSQSQSAEAVKNTAQ
jgi:hypothetical protein